MKRIQLPTVTNCNSCGACCTGQAALPIHMAGHPKSCFRDTPMPSVNPLPEGLRQELLAQTDVFLRDGFPPDGSPCIWYDAETKRCRHYDHRPVLCRDEVQPGDESCLRWRKEKGIDRKVAYRFRKGRLVKV